MKARGSNKKPSNFSYFSFSFPISNAFMFAQMDNKWTYAGLYWRYTVNKQFIKR